MSLAEGLALVVYGAVFLYIGMWIQSHKPQPQVKATPRTDPIRLPRRYSARSESLAAETKRKFRRKA